MSTLIEQLEQKGLLGKREADELEKEVKASGKREEELLIEKKIGSESILFSLKSVNLGTPFIEEISAEGVSLKVLETIPEESAKYYKMIPLAKRDNVIEVGMVYPEDLRAQEALKFLSREGKFICKVYLITPTVFNDLLRQYRTLRGEVEKALGELGVKEKPQKEKTPIRAEDLDKLVEEAPISKGG